MIHSPLSTSPSGLPPSSRCHVVPFAPLCLLFVGLRVQPADRITASNRSILALELHTLQTVAKHASRVLGEACERPGAHKLSVLFTGHAVQPLTAFLAALWDNVDAPAPGGITFPEDAVAEVGCFSTPVDCVRETAVLSAIG